MAQGILEHLWDTFKRLRCQHFSGKLVKNPFVGRFVLGKSTFGCTIFWSLYKLLSVQNSPISFVLGLSSPLT